MNLTEIQHVIEELPAEEQTTLAAWIVDRDRARWDEEIEHDSHRVEREWNCSTE